MAGRVQGKVALVTGGASGIGRGCCELMAAEGARIIVCDLQEALGEEAAAGIREAGGQARFLRLDVSQEADWIAAMDTVRQTEGRLDILVNNAGIGRAAPIVDTTLESWRMQNAVNLDGVFLGVKHGVRLMREGKGGSIVNVASTASMKASPNMGAYSAAKGAVRIFTKTAAKESAAAKDGVRINSVHPGLTETPIWGTTGGDGAPDLDELCKTLVPLGVKGVPADIASGVLWLASDEARYVTGTELVIDGGYIL